MNNLWPQLHESLARCARHHFPFDKGAIPSNGIYVLYEANELGHGADRIVRVGTHTGEAQLPSRLRQHFMYENKDRSIFRKNIGRALLGKEEDPFLDDWNVDLTTRKARERNSGKIDKTKLKIVEARVTDYIQRAFSFVVLPIQDKGRRLTIESKLISSVSWCGGCKPSEAWLGQHSPKEKIRESGLWLVNELYKESLSEQDLSELLLSAGQDGYITN